jgi:hypothetical protein
MKKAGIRSSMPARAGGRREGRAKAIEDKWSSRPAKGVDGTKVLAEFRTELGRVAAGN